MANSMIIHGKNQKIGCFYIQTTQISVKNRQKWDCQVWDTGLKDGRICALWRCWIDRMALIRFRYNSSSSFRLSFLIHHQSLWHPCS